MPASYAAILGCQQDPWACSAAPSDRTAQLDTPIYCLTEERRRDATVTIAEPNCAPGVASSLVDGWVRRLQNLKKDSLVRNGNLSPQNHPCFEALQDRMIQLRNQAAGRVKEMEVAEVNRTSFMDDDYLASLQHMTERIMAGQEQQYAVLREMRALLTFPEALPSPS